MRVQRPLGAYVPLPHVAERWDCPYTTLLSAVHRGHYDDLGVVRIGRNWYLPGKVVDAVAKGQPLPKVPKR